LTRNKRKIVVCACPSFGQNGCSLHSHLLLFFSKFSSRRLPLKLSRPDTVRRLCYKSGREVITEHSFFFFEKKNMLASSAGRRTVLLRPSSLAVRTFTAATTTTSSSSSSSSSSVTPSNAAAAASTNSVTVTSAPASSNKKTKEHQLFLLHRCTVAATTTTTTTTNTASTRSANKPQPTTSISATTSTASSASNSIPQQPLSSRQFHSYSTLSSSSSYPRGGGGGGTCRSTRRTFTTSSAQEASTITNTKQRTFLEWYEGHLAAHPVLTKMFTGSLLWGIGDAVAQIVPQAVAFTEEEKEDENGTVDDTSSLTMEKVTAPQKTKSLLLSLSSSFDLLLTTMTTTTYYYDWPRTGRAALFGFALHAPTSHVHFNFLEWLTHRVGVTGSFGIPIFKAFMEQFVYWSWYVKKKSTMLAHYEWEFSIFLSNGCIALSYYCFLFVKLYTIKGSRIRCIMVPWVRCKACRCNKFMIALPMSCGKRKRLR
jgi:hypothetical protein